MSDLSVYLPKYAWHIVSGLFKEFIHLFIKYSLSASMCCSRKGDGAGVQLPVRVLAG